MIEKDFTERKLKKSRSILHWKMNFDSESLLKRREKRFFLSILRGDGSFQGQGIFKFI